MDSTLLAKMLKDASRYSMEKLIHKYSRSDLDAMLKFMQQSIFQTLPLSDFYGKPIVWAPSMLPPMDFGSVRRIMAAQPGNEEFGIRAMEEEIYASLTIENINTSRDSIRRILNGYAPRSDDESRIHGMKLGLDYIADRTHTITEKNLHTLYQLAIGNYLAEDEHLIPGAFYRHDAVYITDGTQSIHAGLPQEKLPAAMRQVISLANQPGSNELILAAILHFQLAYLHPYFDGNGRMARLLHLWYLVQKGYSSALFIPFSKYVNASRSDYYKAYGRVEENAEVSGVTDVTPFVAYFIQNVYNQLAQTESEITVSSIFEDALRDGKITEKEKDLWAYVLTHYGAEPFSTKQLELDSRMAAYATIRSFVLKFERLGLLQVQHYGNRNKYQVASTH